MGPPEVQFPEIDPITRDSTGRDRGGGLFDVGRRILEAEIVSTLD